MDILNQSKESSRPGMDTSRQGMDTPRELLDALLERRDLAEQEAAALLGFLTEPSAAPAMNGALLAALRAKGVTADELRGFAVAMLERAVKPALPSPLTAIDIVGTGGDSSGSLNLSTGAALLTAAAGMPVVKHGNRSISSRSGSADLLEQLGLGMPLDAAAAGRCFELTGFTFLFAPYYHPAMKSVAPVRAALGVRTVFNLLGPLTNPAAPSHRLIGAYDAATAELLARTLAGMPIERAWVVHGAGGWDEVTPIGPCLVYDVSPGRVQRLIIDPADWGLAVCSPLELAGADAAANAAALRAVFERRDRGAHYDALCLQSGLALHIGGRAAAVEDGIAAARATIDSGRAAEWLAELQRLAPLLREGRS
jgi:anthranilate phosphoribosyltransferase